MDLRRTPVLVGIAQRTLRDKTREQLDPIAMMAGVARDAAVDAGLDAVPAVDTLGIVNCLSKALARPAQDLSDRLRIDPAWTGYTSVGATAPQWFANTIAKRIFEGRSEWALICGAEAFYTKARVTQLTGLVQSHTEVEERMQTPFVGDTRMPVTAAELRYGLVSPVHMYALFENARRAHRGQTISAQRQELAEFCAGMSQTAAQNEFAWFRAPREADTIARVTEQNRMVSFPYTKLMCSNAHVNQAAAVLMTTVDNAEAAGVAKDKMIFIRGCGEGEDVFHPSERPKLWESPSVVTAVDQALAQASVELNEVRYVDLYSCFPSATRIVADMLGLEDLPSAQASVTGGMACFGGPGNNYSLHAICTMVEQLRREPEAVGLVHSLSWYLSKHAVGVYSASPGEGSWRREAPVQTPQPYQPVRIVEEANGVGVVESYALGYGRKGRPAQAVVVGRDGGNDRFLAMMTATDAAMQAMTETEIIGTSGAVRYDRSTRMNLFELAT